ncbi:MAG: hypothetical protein HGA37_16000, partial [Lentimicrobium sp.]|nr:hypothetical protein [Lentimicrobium sp.]
MKIKLTFLVVVVLAGLSLKGQIPATKDIKSPQPEIGIVEHLDEYLPDDLTFTGTDDKTYNLKQLIDKPTVLMFVY